jgi:hypothetical protein
MWGGDNTSLPVIFSYKAGLTGVEKKGGEKGKNG